MIVASIRFLEFRLQFQRRVLARRGQARWSEIWEAPFGGRDRQAVARSPEVIGDDAAAEQRAQPSWSKAGLLRRRCSGMRDQRHLTEVMQRVLLATRYTPSQRRS